MSAHSFPAPTPPGPSSPGAGPAGDDPTTASATAVRAHRTRRRLSRLLRTAVASTAVLTLAALGVAAAPGAAEAATVDTNAWYVLKNRQSGKVLDVRGASTEPGAQLIQWTRTDAANQQFRFVDSGSGWYRLLNRNSGKALDVWEWSTASGAEIRQWDDHGGANQNFRLADSEGDRVRLVNQHSGLAAGVTNRSTADGATITQSRNLNQYNQQWELVKVSGATPAPNPDPTPGNPAPVPGNSPQGWASQNGGTTGGGNAAPVTVSNASALTSAVSGNSAKVVRVSGTISCSGMIRVGSNTTVIGTGSNARITGCGLNVAKVSNVVIRNIAFSGWDDDAINIETSTNVWVDHNSFSNGYDGTVDTKRGSDFVTISWNRFFDHDKNSLVGHSDSNASQDRGKLRVTYHHNWFDGTNQRNPRVRFGNPVHVYNNYYASVGRSGGYGVASTKEGGVLVEGNYFENTPDPFHLGEGSSPAGTLVARNNHHVGSGSGQQGGSVRAVTYPYTLDRASDVKAIVSAGAGTGRI